MIKHSTRKMKDENGSRFSVRGKFDGVQTFQEIKYLMPPVGTVDRLVLDFSHLSNIRPIEVYALLAEMAADQRFREIEITIEGLRFDKISTSDFSALEGIMAVTS
jgi:hypothetical protein